jgi:GH43 family beta-xylosidase
MSGGGKTYGEICLMASVANTSVAGPGHNSILIDDAGDYWIYYHAYSEKDNHITRHLFMDKLAWDEDGFPYVSYFYENDEGEVKESKYKPSFDIDGSLEFDGPRFIIK